MPREHITQTRVRYGETDRMGVVYHGNYFVYFEIGRTEMLRSVGLAYRDMEEKGFRLVVTEAACRYLGAVTYDDEVEIRTWLEEAGRVRMKFRYRLMLGGRPVATGHTDLACLDPSGRPTRIPAEIVEKLKGWV